MSRLCRSGMRTCARAHVKAVPGLTRRLLCSWSLRRCSTSRSCFLWASCSCREATDRTVKRAQLCWSWRICNSHCPTWLPSLPRRRLDGDAAERSLSTCRTCCSHMRPREWGEMWRCGNSSKSAGSSSLSFTFTGARKDRTKVWNRGTPDRNMARRHF